MNLILEPKTPNQIELVATTRNFPVGSQYIFNVAQVSRGFGKYNPTNVCFECRQRLEKFNTRNKINQSMICNIILNTKLEKPKSLRNSDVRFDFLF